MFVELTFLRWIAGLDTLNRGASNRQHITVLVLAILRPARRIVKQLKGMAPGGGYSELGPGSVLMR